MAENEGFWKTLVRELRPHAVWDAVKVGGALMIAVLYALWQKMQHLSVDWYLVVVLFLLSFLLFTIGISVAIYTRKKELVAAEPKEGHRVPSTGKTTKAFDAQGYIAQKKCVNERFPSLGHGALEVLSLFATMGAMSARQVTDHLLKYKFPNAERVFDDLHNDSVPFIVSSGASEFTLNPTLEKVVEEAVKADESAFLKQVAEMSSATMKHRILYEPGFQARWDAIQSRKIS